MPKFIVKLEHGNTTWYLEWSTVSDAPRTYGMPLAEFREYMRDEYGRSGCRDLDARIERADVNGTSMMHYSCTAKDAFTSNRTGPDESELTYDQIVHKYCVARPTEN